MNAPQSPAAVKLSTDALAPPGWAVAVTRAANALTFFPALLVSGFYGEFLLAWLQLGRAPLPSLDDPKGIPGVFVVHTAVTVLMICTPMAALLAVASNAVALFLKSESARFKALRVVASTAIWTLGFTFLRHDPYGVMDWWMD